MESTITVTIRATRGSAPRDAGAALQVHQDGFSGTIGGGALEWSAIHLARDMLANGTKQMERTLPLGPGLGQCCGGVVTLDFVAGVTHKAPGDQPIWIWGAGHVGRAIAATLAPFDNHEITLIDDAPQRLPDPLLQGVFPLIAADMPRAVPHAPKTARHFVLTYSHDIDLALCDALLRHGFTSCGLIGSATKWARFRKRLRALGHENAIIERIDCPIGDKSLGKHPQAIAVGIAAQLLSANASVPALQKDTV